MKLNFLTRRGNPLCHSAPLALLLIALLGCSKAAPAPNQRPYESIKHFADLGSNPTALIEGKDGSLYGTMRDGGRKWEGVVFKINRDGSGYTVLRHFTGYRQSADGSWPQGVIE